MLTLKQQQTFAENGYLCFKKILPSTLIEEMRHEAKNLVEKELGERNPDEDVFGDLVYDVVPRLPIFKKVLEVPVVIKLVQELIGCDVQPMGGDLFRARPGQKLTCWHRDAIRLYMKALDLEVPDYYEINQLTRKYPLQSLASNGSSQLPSLCRMQVTLAIYLNDISNESGPLRVFPSSHRWEYFHTCVQEPFLLDATPSEEEVFLPGSAGTIIAHESGLWHTASSNNSTTDCLMLLLDIGPKTVR